MRRNFRLPILYIVFNLFFSFSYVLGQCDFNKINEGMNLYEFVKFEDADQIILPCILSKTFKEPNDNNKALRLLSLIAIAEDSLIMA